MTDIPLKSVAVKHPRLLNENNENRQKLKIFMQILMNFATSEPFFVKPTSAAELLLPDFNNLAATTQNLTAATMSNVVMPIPVAIILVWV